MPPSFSLYAMLTDNPIVQVVKAPKRPDGQPGATRTELERSSVALMQAAGLFKRLMHLPKAQLLSRNLKKENITKHVTHCDHLSKTASQLIEKVKTADELRQVHSRPHHLAQSLIAQQQQALGASVPPLVQRPLAICAACHCLRQHRWEHRLPVLPASRQGDLAHFIATPSSFFYISLSRSCLVQSSTLHCFHAQD